MTPDIETKTYNDGARATGPAPLPDQSPAEQAERLLIKPTVGRKVWYRPSKYDVTGIGAMVVQTGQPLDATVIAVWGDRCVNLQVLDITGKAFTKMSCSLKQEGDSMPVDGEGNEVGGYAEWMPYQTGQARKAV